MFLNNAFGYFHFCCWNTVYRQEKNLTTAEIREFYKAGLSY